MAKGFKTDNMTVSQILNLDWQTINSFDTREMSRALRTVSLAANKRLSRLRKNAKLTSEGYVAKNADFAPYALNAITKDGRKKFKWGVKKAHGSRNKMLKQISEIRTFWNMSTSSVKAAAEVRKQTERFIFGQTREEAAKGKKKNKREAIYADYEDKLKNTFDTYRKFLEYQGVNKWSAYKGSDEIIPLIGNLIENDTDPMEALKKAIEKDEELYIRRQDEFLKDTEEGFFL